MPRPPSRGSRTAGRPERRHRRSRSSHPWAAVTSRSCAGRCPGRRRWAPSAAMKIPHRSARSVPAFSAFSDVVQARKKPADARESRHVGVLGSQAGVVQRETRRTPARAVADGRLRGRIPSPFGSKRSIVRTGRASRTASPACHHAGNAGNFTRTGQPVLRVIRSCSRIAGDFHRPRGPMTLIAASEHYQLYPRPLGLVLAAGLLQS